MSIMIPKAAIYFAAGAGVILILQITEIARALIRKMRN